MKYGVMGFSQEQAIIHGVTWKELLFLDWFLYWYQSGSMHEVNVNGKKYGWIDREYALKQLPLIEISSPNALTKFIARMAEKGLLQRVRRSNEAQRGSRAFYAPGPLVKEIALVPAAVRYQERQEEIDYMDDQHTYEIAGNADHQSDGIVETPRPPIPSDCSYTPTEIYTPSDKNIPAIIPDAGKPASVEDTPLTELSEEDRELYHILKESFLSQVTGGKFTNWPKESKGLKRLLRYSTTFAVDNRSNWLQALLEAFLKLVGSHDRFWSNQPFLPSVLASDGIFPRVHKEMVGSLKDKAVADYMTKNNLW